MAKIKRSTRPTKKFMVEVGGKTVHFGASGMRIKAGTEAGDSYCARSAGIVTKKKYTCLTLFLLNVLALLTMKCAN